MIFQDLLREIELYLHIDNEESRYLIKSFINESITDFVRLREWEELKKVVDITLTGAGSYSLNSLTDPFEGEIALLTEGGNEYHKWDYKNYLQLSSKSQQYAISGKILYVTGSTGTLKLHYISRGIPLTLVLDTDENLVTKYYADIIKMWSVIKMLDYLGDNVKKEEEKLDLKITSAIKKERRINKQGKIKMVFRG